MINDEKKLALTFGMRIGLFVCIFLLCFVIASVLNWFLTYKFGITAASLRISTVLQDLLVFILPALAVSVLVTRVPATFLSIDRKPSASLSLLAILTLVVSIPVMNQIIDWNASMSLPHWMQGIEEQIKSAEEAAQASVGVMLGGTSLASLVVTILIVGIFTGLSEELFFRGGLLSLLRSRPMNPHLAIWLTAVIFSALHLQFYGFVPRMLLGAFFGYLVWWSGSLWLPVIAHAFNNSLVALFTWLAQNGICNGDLENVHLENSAADLLLTIASLLLSVAAVWAIRALALKKLKGKSS